MFEGGGGALQLPVIKPGIVKRRHIPAVPLLVSPLHPRNKVAERWRRNELLMILNGSRTLLLSPAASLPRYFRARLRQGQLHGVGGGVSFFQRVAKRKDAFLSETPPSVFLLRLRFFLFSFFLWFCRNMEGAD